MNTKEYTFFIPEDKDVEALKLKQYTKVCYVLIPKTYDIHLLLY